MDSDLVPAATAATGHPSREAIEVGSGTPRSATTAGDGSRLRILYATAEDHPTHRVDVRILFGEALPAAGVDVDLVAVMASDVDPSIPRKWPGGRAFLAPGGNRLEVMLRDLSQQFRLFTLAKRGYGAIVVRDKPILGVVGWLAARFAGIPFVYWMSYPMPEAYLWLSRQSNVGRARRLWLAMRGRLGQACLRYLLVPRADWLFAQTDEMIRYQRTVGLAHDRVSAVPMGVDFSSIPAHGTLPEELHGRRVAVYLGTLDRARNPHLLVDAAMIVARTCPDFTLLIIGEADEPSDRGWLRDYAKQQGAGVAVHFTGRMPFERGLAMARAAFVGLSPVPRTELTEMGSPTKAMEYLACGIPVVCNDQPDQAFVVERSGGGVVVPMDAPSFAAGIMSLIDDPFRARELAKAGRRWVRAHRGYDKLGAEVAARLTAVSTSAVRVS